jgi:hypothetical protein
VLAVVMLAAFVCVAVLASMPLWLPAMGVKTSGRDRLDRLAERARWRHSPAACGRRGRRAWRKLARKSRRDPSGPAAGALWRSWVWDPDDKGWALLSRRRGRRPVADLRAALAASPPSVGNWPGLAAFCARHDLVPAEPVELARFYVLTRQQEQWRALDPDSVLLAAAYRAANQDVRTALREALAGQGDLDVLRVVVAGDDTRVPDMTKDERDYLTRQFAADRDWAKLWRLARDLSLPDAVAAAAMIDEDWRPDGDQERDLYALLSRAGAGADVRRSSKALRAAAITIRVPGSVLSCALPASGRRLAVITGDTGRTNTISVYALPDGRLVTRHGLSRHDRPSELAYLPDGTLAVVEHETRAEDGTRVYRCADSGAVELVTGDDLGSVARAVRGHRFGRIGGSGIEHWTPPPANPCHAWAFSGAYVNGDGSHVTVDTPELLALRSLADRPQAAWRHADLAAAFAAAPVVRRCPAARPFYDLLCACLEHRFGGEIGIGRARTRTGAEEIAISHEGARP